ncbi:hypothetical protein NE865_13592 [Phthorimaea operculella]|nr:hypothetical protein NE865_13592 [Phthorimaea operculella]
MGVSLDKSRLNRPSRVIFKRNFQAIKNDLRKVDWGSVIYGDDVDAAADRLQSTLGLIFDKNSRTVTISRSKYNLKPWITPGLMRCMKHRDNLHLRVRSDPNNKMLEHIYLRYRNFFNDLLRKLKSSHENSELEENRYNPKGLWKSIKNICYLTTVKKEPTELLYVPGATDEGHSLDLCNEYFSGIGNKLADDILTKINETEHGLANSLKPLRTQVHSFFLEPTDIFEVRSLIKNLHNAKTPGIDKLNNLALKEIMDEIIFPLTDLFNMSLATGNFPRAWKLAVVCPIYKGGSKEAVNNYRPISLLGVF